MGTHYSTCFNVQAMMRWAKDVADEIKNYSQEHDLYPILVYSGMSGISHATYLATYLKTNFTHVYIRKNEEKSHGKQVEHNIDEYFFYSNSQYDKFNKDNCFIVFVDDFVSKFNTFNHCIKYLSKEDWIEDVDNIKIMFALYSMTHLREVVGLTEFRIDDNLTVKHVKEAVNKRNKSMVENDK